MIPCVRPYKLDLWKAIIAIRHLAVGGRRNGTLFPTEENNEEDFYICTARRPCRLRYANKPLAEQGAMKWSICFEGPYRHWQLAAPDYVLMGRMI